MIFQHTWPKVLSGEKTATSRIVKPGDVELVGGELPAHSEYFTRDNALYVRGPAELVNTLPITRVDRNGRVLYEVGKDYAVQPGRGQKSVGRIRITALDKWDVRTCTGVRAHQEGYQDVFTFLNMWTSMHDKIFHARWAGELQYGSTMKRVEMLDVLSGRDAAKYTAWFIRFELLEVYK